ncbi:camp-dependent protein kinase 2 [Halteromyces radiatus]|uniref:camp-dependent protein kinase 2 n=1 Tax=Halteromyces radiatus TaxID=101107 RepID=UPI0022208C8F|nr:camp-dependent protein kinase 2 [Halteromyces radiatus]KAI8085001.1 camp-dependent protein kinase 2 [Halteromyces radiatus]
MSFFNKIIDKAKHHHHDPVDTTTRNTSTQQHSTTNLTTDKNVDMTTSSTTLDGTRMSIDKPDNNTSEPMDTQTSDMTKDQQDTIITTVDLPSTTTTSTPNKTLNEKDTQQQLQQQVYSKSSYTSVFNDQSILQQRQNRPKLKLADFHILRTLGTGSFGRVHLVQSRVNVRYYAIKVLKKTEVVRLKQVEHTNNEKHILESVAHPFLVNMWGTFQDSINLYMVMDYVPGGELFSILRRSQRFPDHVAKFYAAEVVLAIEYLHSKDIIYRDLKPENLLLDAQGHIKITDFGFAKHVPDITWTLCGTPDYLAPEVIQSRGYGKAVDWWSLGILIFEMLAGHPPFFDDDHLKLYEKILAGRIKWPSYFDPNAKDLLRRLLTSDLSKRFGNLRNGAEDVKRHAWFEGVDFNRLLARQHRPPYVPSIRGDGDASHFDRYPESNEQYGIQTGPDPYVHFFSDF